jgi:hypothetical protein
MVITTQNKLASNSCFTVVCLMLDFSTLTILSNIASCGRYSVKTQTYWTSMRIPISRRSSRIWKMTMFVSRICINSRRYTHSLIISMTFACSVFLFCSVLMKIICLVFMFATLNTIAADLVSYRSAKATSSASTMHVVTFRSTSINFLLVKFCFHLIIKWI